MYIYTCIYILAYICICSIYMIYDLWIYIWCDHILHTSPCSKSFKLHNLLLYDKPGSKNSNGFTF